MISKKIFGDTKRRYVRYERNGRTDLHDDSRRISRSSSQIKAHLFAHVNREYAKFVTLSNPVDGFKESTIAQRNLLEELRDRVSEMKLIVADTLGRFSEKMDEQAKMVTRRRNLELCVKIDESIQLIDKILHNRSSEDADKDQSCLEEMRLERAAQEYSRLVRYVWRGHGLPFVKHLTPRLEVARRAILDRLEVLFAGEIVPDEDVHFAEDEHAGEDTRNVSMTSPSGSVSSSTSNSALEYILRSFETMGCTRDVEYSFVELVMRPFVADLFTRGRLDRGGPRGKCAGLSDLFGRVETFVNDQCAMLLRCARQVGLSSGRKDNRRLVGVRTFDFIGNAVWFSVVERVIELESAVFASGDPDVFHRNYTASVAFVERLDRMRRRYSAPDEDMEKKGAYTTISSLRDDRQDASSSLWTHPSTKTYFAKWSFDVYFHLRREEILAPLNKLLQRSVETGPSRPPANATCDPRLTLKSSKAVLVALQRCWDKSVFLPCLAHQFLRLCLQILARYVEWLCDLSREVSTGTIKRSTLVHALHDALLMRRQMVSKEWSKRMPSRICVNAFQEQANEFDRPEQTIIAALGSAIAQVSESALQSIRSIAATYRMSSKPLPSTPSAFVPGILRPFSHMIQVWRSYLPSAVLAKIVTTALLRTVKRYCEICTDLLETVRKTEESLSRLRRLRSSASQTEAETSDVEKIREQLRLDVRYFDEQASKIRSEELKIDSATWATSGVEGALSSLKAAVGAE